MVRSTVTAATERRVNKPTAETHVNRPFPQRFHMFLPRLRLRILDISSCLLTKITSFC